MPEDYFDQSKVIVRKIEKSKAEEMIVKYHYTHTFSLCTISYGIFYITDNIDLFFGGNEEKLIGCVVYGGPVGRSAALSISPLVKINEVIELVRLFIFDGFGKNIESFCISQSLKLLKKDMSHLKVVISYADNEAGHRGIIYQAANFLYQGNSALALMPNYSISLVNSPYKWMHSRTAFSTFGSHNIEHLKKRIGHIFWRKKEATKHRYIYILGNQTQKKKILSNSKHPSSSYPKDTSFVEEVQEIKVNNQIENHFFG